MADFHLSSLKDVYNIPEEKPKPQVVPQPQYIPVPHYVPHYVPVPVRHIRPTRLNRIDQAMDEKPPLNNMDPMLPSLWWVFTYMGLAALTAIGIRSSK